MFGKDILEKKLTCQVISLLLVHPGSSKSECRKVCCRYYQLAADILEHVLEEEMYDLIVFGASGFTGKYVVETIVNTLKAGTGGKFTYAVSGRSERKLDIILKEVSDSTGMTLSNFKIFGKNVILCDIGLLNHRFFTELLVGEDVTGTKKILADVDDQQSLVNMAKQGKCVLNCVGPYRFSGKQVVDACIEAGAHCVDVSGEPEYLEKVQLQCDEAAKQKGVYIVGACGFDSIPVDMGVVHLIKNFGGDVNSVEEYVESNNEQKVCFPFSQKVREVG